MLLPYRDSPNPLGFTPWVNYALIAANVAVFVLVTLPLSAQGVDPGDPALAAYLEALGRAASGTHLAGLSAYELFLFEHGFKPGAPEVSDLLASLFLHGGLLHLAGNMLFLWIYGDNVEHRLGRATYLAVYLLSGVVATLVFSAFARGSMVPLVGASGAISGVLGLYFLFFPRNQVKVFVAFFPFFFQSIWVRARWVLGFYVVVDNLLPFLGGSSSNVAHGAHLGGFIAGLGVAWLVERSGSAPQRAPKQPLPRARPPSFGPSSAAVETALRRGDIDAAVAAAITMSPAALARLEARDLYAIARRLAEVGQDELATRALRRALSGPDSDRVRTATLHLALGELRLAQGQSPAAYQHLMTVLDLLPRNQPEALRAEAALQALAARGELTSQW